MSFLIAARIDWVAATFKGKVNLVELFGDCKTSNSVGRWGYDVAQQTEDGVVVLMSSTRKDMGVHIIVGATALVNHEVRTGVASVRLLKAMVETGGNVRRIDLCLDVRGDNFKIRELVKQYQKGNIRTRARGGTVITNVGEPGRTLYIGRRGSRKLLRIYDKAAQLRLDENWTRIELELRRDAARQAANILLSSSSWQNEIPQLIKGFCDFEHCSQWRSVIGQKEIAIIQPIVEDSKTRKWLLDVCAVSIAKLYADGDKKIVRDVMKRASDIIRNTSKEERHETGLDQIDKIISSRLIRDMQD